MEPDWPLMAKIVGCIAASSVAYSIVAGVAYSLYVRYGWFVHECSYSSCSHCHKEAEKTIFNRGLASGFWPVFVVPLFIGWLYLVAVKTTTLFNRKDKLPEARIVKE